MRRMPFIEFGAILLVIVLCAGVVVSPLFGRVRSGSIVSCMNNLKQVGIIFKMYAYENEGRYPPGSAVSGWNPYTIGVEYIYPEYLTSLDILHCPDRGFDEKGLAADVAALQAGDTEGRWPALDLETAEARNLAVAQLAARTSMYAYFPWATVSAEDFLVLDAALNAYRAKVCDNVLPCDFYAEIDLAALGVGTRPITEQTDPVAISRSGRIPLMREEVERCVASYPDVDVDMLPRQIPVLCDNLDDLTSDDAPHHEKSPWYRHARPAANVLFLDGHVERLAFPGPYPVAEAVVAIGLSGGVEGE